MSEIVLRMAKSEDVPAIMEIMHQAHAAMADPSAYILDDADYVFHYVNRNGFVLLNLSFPWASLWRRHRVCRKTIWAGIWAFPMTR